MVEIVFRYKYHPDSGSNDISAYDASQALYGIARSLSVTTHYVLNGRVIKQAPSLARAKVLVRPPQVGSFEFIAPVVDFFSTPAGQIAGGLTLAVAGNYLTDLTRLLYRRLTGQSEQASSPETQKLLRERPGDVDALADSIEDDVVRLHRPIYGGAPVFNIYGGTVNFGTFNQNTYDYAKAKILGDNEEEFFGNVASFNANSLNGRFWLEEEERTVGFSKDREADLHSTEKKMLAWSLNEYANNRPGRLCIKGVPLRSKQVTLKAIFITGVSKA
ncbi:hypothetical protein [Falsiroseomonas sp.]|uniref:DUF7946 domain-containing protein n=1 Tax=Falsiroseomonas sp. TaxID=2870721 RepID=UPI0034A22CC9